MKTVFSGLIAFGLVAGGRLAAEDFTLFADDFSHGSTLNGLSLPGGPPEAAHTSYDIASPKATASSIGPGLLGLRLAGGTTSGFWEAQGLFTTNAFALFNPGDYLELAIVFTNGIGSNAGGNTLLAGYSSSALWIGLFNSGGHYASLNPPVAGALANAGLNTLSGSSNAAGNCASWVGYAAQIRNGAAPSIVTRVAQSGSTSANQDLLGSNVGSGAFNTPTGTNLSVGVAQNISLVPGNPYTVMLRITFDAIFGPWSMTISNALFDGLGTSGTLLFSQTTLSTNLVLATAFDGFAFGALNKSSQQINPAMDVHSVTVTGHNTPIMFVPCDAPPAIAAVQAGGGQLKVTVAVPDCVGWLTLESRANAQTGGWVAEQTLGVTNARTASFQLASSAPMKFLRARGRTRSAARTFFGQVETGLSLIRAYFPAAQLYYVQATNPVPANSPNLAWLKIVCLVDQNADSAWVDSTNPFVFGPVQYPPVPLIGGGLVSWPVAMDITEADALLKQAGYGGAYNYVMLRQPLYPGLNEPYYVFSMTAGGDVYVGVNDGAVLLPP